MNIQQGTIPSEIDATLAELKEASRYLSDKCREARAEDNHAAVRDLTTHILRLEKEYITLAEKHGKLISLAEAKIAFDSANDVLMEAVWELAPDKAPAILTRSMELGLSIEMRF